MSVNRDLLDLLIRYHGPNPPDYALHLNGAVFAVTGVSIENSPIPVNKPTTRGGVYFSDKFAYKMRGTVGDLSIVPLLTKSMLGPNTEFGDLRIVTNIESEGKPLTVEIFTNLTNSIQTPTSIELSMIIVRLERA